MRPRRPAVLQNSQLLVHLPFPSSRDEKLVTETPLDSALTNADVCKSFRIRSYANCRVSPALFSQSLISDPVSSTLVPRIGRSPVRGFFSVLSAVNCGLSTACPEGRRRVGFCANSFRCNTYEQLASVDGSVDILEGESMPQAVEVVGQAEQERLADLLRQATSRSPRGELTFDH